MADPVSPLVAPVSPAAAPPAPAPARPSTPAKVDQATYDRMSVPEKHAYAAKFSQPNGAAAPATPTATEWASMSAQERTAYDRQRSDAMADSYGKAIPDDKTPPADPAKTAPEDASSAKIKIGDVELTEAEWRAAATDKAVQDNIKASMPSADSYRAQLPQDFKIPEGVEYQWNENDPLMVQAKTLAHQLNLGQEGFSKILALYAGAQVGEASAVQAARNAEIAKLGVTAAARLDSIERFFRGQIGDAEGKQLFSRLFTASDVVAAEKLMARFTSQGVAGFSQVGRDVRDDRTVDQATYDSWNYSQKKNYAEKFHGGGR